MTRTRTRPKAKTEAPVPTAPELVELFNDEIAFAKQNSAKVTAAIMAADAEIADAEQAVQEALDNVARGQDGAEEQHKGALTRRYSAVSQRVGLDEQQTACMRVIRSNQERVRQLFESNLDEFLPAVEDAVAEAVAAAKQLEPKLRDYLAAFERAATAWKPLSPGVRSKVEADETAAGYYRSGESLDRDLRTPECPVSSSLLSRIASVVPRPPAMSPDFDGNPFVSEPSPDGVDVSPPLVDADGNRLIFDSDRQ